MKNKQSQTSRIEVIETFVKSFLETMGDRINESEKLAVQFCVNFACWLIKHSKFKFEVTYNTEEYMITFCGSHERYTKFLTIRYEAGMAPLCYWMHSKGRTNVNFNELKVSKDPELWYERTADAYIADQKL